MKLKELLKVYSGCVDVYENTADLIAIALDWDCNTMSITKEGQKKFSKALNYRILNIDKNYLILDSVSSITKEEFEECDFDDKIPEATQNAIDFFYSLAGYCNEKDYKKWFDIK